MLYQVKGQCSDGGTAVPRQPFCRGAGGNREETKKSARLAQAFSTRIAERFEFCFTFSPMKYPLLRRDQEGYGYNLAVKIGSFERSHLEVSKVLKSTESIC